MNPCKLCKNLTTQIYILSSVPKPLCNYCAKQISKQYNDKVKKITNENNSN